MMKFKSHTAILVVIVLTTAFGCELYTQDGYEEQFFVEAYLVANKPLSEVLISKTSALGEEAETSNTFVSGANVEIRQLNADSSVAEVYQYQEYEGADGVYFPENSAVVKEKQLYQLSAQLPNGEEIESYTTVPDNFKTVNELNDNYLYQGEQQVKTVITPSNYPDRQGYYLFTASAQDTSQSNLTPFYQDLVSEESISVASYWVNSSSILYGTERNENGNIILTMPWTTIAFYGENEIIINAIDENLYDFWSSYNEQTGVSSFVPGEIQNLQYNVNGGIGIFGSMATDTHRVNITRPD